MKNIVIICVLAVLLFALSAALSLYLTPRNKADDEHAAPRPAPERRAERKKVDEQPDEPKRPAATAESPPAAPPATKTDEVANLLDRLRQRFNDLQRREEEIQKQEQRLQLVMDDIRGERGVIDGFRAQLSAELKQLDKKREGISRGARNLEEQKKAAEALLAEMKKREIEYDRNETKNLGRMATISDSMPPDKAARVLEELANSGQLETAVKLLGEMKERRAAAVLAEVRDVTLAAQLLKGLRDLKRPGPVLDSPPRRNP